MKSVLLVLLIFAICLSLIGCACHGRDKGKSATVQQTDNAGTVTDTTPATMILTNTDFRTRVINSLSPGLASRTIRR